MPKNPDRKDLLKNRKEMMKEAFELDGRKSASPFDQYWRGVYKDGWGKLLWEITLLDVHHLNDRDNTGRFDGVEWLITVSRLEHTFMEQGCKQWKMTGEQYTYLILYKLAQRPEFRWRSPLRLYEQKLTPERISELQRFQIPK